MPVDALTHQSLPSLINGVSQQPAPQRLPSQAEAQENCVSDVAVGVRRRPPSEHLALLAGSAAGGSPTGGMFAHVIDLGADGQYVALIEDADVNVFDLSDGSEVTVTDNATGSPGSYDYLQITPSATVTAQNSFEAVTVADYTIIVNKRITPAKTAGSPTVRAHEFLFVIKEPAVLVAGSGSANPEVTLEINGAAADTTTLGSSTQNSAQVRLEIWNNLTTSAALGTGVAGTGSFSNWEFDAIGDNVIYGVQVLNTGTRETVQAYDGYGDTLFELFATTTTAGSDARAQRFSDLPHDGKDDFVVKVSGDDGNDEGDFYVIYDEEEGVWTETVKSGLINSFDADTMPHTLVYDSGTGNFTFGPATWADRAVGDTVSAEDPSFIGNPIKDVAIHKNRLALLADENVILSEAGEFFNFWPTTVTTIVDSDPIDVAATGNRVSILDYMEPYQGNLTLFSATGDTISELRGSRDEALTIANARVEDRGTYPVAAVRPAAVGDSVYFVVDRDDRSGVYAYRQTDVDLFRADEVTSHVASYLPEDIFKIAPGTAENMLVFLSSATGETHRAYIYRFWVIGTDQVMSSWSRWSFDSAATILSCFWVQSKLYFLFERQDGIHLEVVDFGKAVEDATLDHRVHLDSLFEVTGTYSAVFDETTWVVPYDQDTNGGTYRIITSGDWGNARGRSIAVKSSATDLAITATGDHSANSVYIGREYTSTYELSEVVLRGRNEDAVAEVTGRLQLRKGHVVYRDTGTFEAALQSRDDSDEYTHTFTSQYLNEAVLGPVSIDSGVFEFDIAGHSRNVRIIFRSSSHFGFNLAAFEWEGRFYRRS